MNLIGRPVNHHLCARRVAATGQQWCKASMKHLLPQSLTHQVDVKAPRRVMLRNARLMSKCLISLLIKTTHKIGYLGVEVIVHT